MFSFLVFKFWVIIKRYIGMPVPHPPPPPADPEFGMPVPQPPSPYFLEKDIDC